MYYDPNLCASGTITVGPGIAISSGYVPSGSVSSFGGSFQRGSIASGHSSYLGVSGLLLSGAICSGMGSYGKVYSSDPKHTVVDDRQIMVKPKSNPFYTSDRGW